jgi:hypothetical protein
MMSQSGPPGLVTTPDGMRRNLLQSREYQGWYAVTPGLSDVSAATKINLWVFVS